MLVSCVVAMALPRVVVMAVMLVVEERDGRQDGRETGGCRCSRDRLSKGRCSRRCFRKVVWSERLPEYKLAGLGWHVAVREQRTGLGVSLEVAWRRSLIAWQDASSESRGWKVGALVTIEKGESAGLLLVALRLIVSTRTRTLVGLLGVGRVSQ